MHKPTALALDLGTTTGYALGRPGAVMSGSVSFQPSRFDSPAIRLIKFRSWLDRMAAAHPIREVVYEAVRAHAGVTAAHIYGGLMGTLQVWCADKGIPFRGIPVSTIKKSATGRGSAKKPEMIAAMRAKGYAPQDDNEADALALLECWAAEKESEA